jgi:hypothetical protein
MSKAAISAVCAEPGCDAPRYRGCRHCQRHHMQQYRAQKQQAALGSDLERAFDTYLRQFAPTAPAPEKEVLFAPPRKWRFDRCWPRERVSVELEGGTWKRSRHTSGSGYSADCSKYNAAILEGWILLRFTTDMLRDDPEGCIAQVVEALEMRKQSNVR